MLNNQYTIKDLNFWKITVGLALASFIIFSFLYAFQPLLPFFTIHYNISITLSSFSMSSTIIGLVTGLFTLGLYSDRHGRTAIILFSLIGAIIPFLLIPLTHSFNLLLILRFIQGFAIAGLPAAAIAYISEEIEQESAKIAIAFYISSNALGGMIGRVFSGYVTENYSFQAAIYSLSLFGGVITLLIFLILPKSKYFIKSNVSINKDLKAFGMHLKNPTLILLFGFGIILQLSFTGVWTFIPFHLTNAPFNLTIETIAYLFLAYIFGVIGAPLSSTLANKFGLKKVKLVAVIMMVIGIIMTLSASVSVIITGLCITCFGFFTAHSLTATSVSEVAMHHKGTASSLYFSAYYIGVALGSSILGPIYESYSWIVFILIISLIPLGYLLLLTKKVN